MCSAPPQGSAMGIAHRAFPLTVSGLRRNLAEQAVSAPPERGEARRRGRSTAWGVQVGSGRSPRLDVAPLQPFRIQRLRPRRTEWRTAARSGPSGTAQGAGQSAAQALALVVSGDLMLSLRSRRLACAIGVLALAACDSQSPTGTTSLSVRLK